MKRDLRKSIDVIHHNLVLAWNYYYILEALFEEAKTGKRKIDAFPLFFTVLHRSLLESLFARMAQFVDKRHDAYSLWHLLGDIRRDPTYKWVHEQASQDEAKLDYKQNATLLRCRNWRHGIVAHLTDNIEDAQFYSDNTLHLNDIKQVLTLFDELVAKYSDCIVGIPFGTHAANIKIEVQELMKSINV